MLSSLILRYLKKIIRRKTDIGESVHKTVILGCKLGAQLYERLTCASFFNCVIFYMILFHIRLALSTRQDFILSLPAVRISQRC